MGHQPRNTAGWLRLQFRLFLRRCFPYFLPRGSGARRPLAVISMLFVLSIVATGVYLVVPVTLLPAWHDNPLRTAFWLSIFMWSISCTVISYLLTALAHPGRVPESWRPTLFQQEDPANPGIALPLTATETPTESNAVYEVSTKPPPTPNLYPVVPPAVLAAGTAMLRADGRHRYCDHCNMFKPDRAHHCSTCRECVLRMDHHCPFTGDSCVGFLNRKFFLLFLYYATISCFLVALLTPGAIYDRLNQLEARPTMSALAWIILEMMGYVICALHALALAPFTAFHTYLVLKNRTTIENQEVSPPIHADVLRRSDQGWLNNWKVVFGPRPLLWFIPVTMGRDTDVIDPQQRPADEVV